MTGALVETVAIAVGAGLVASDPALDSPHADPARTAATIYPVLRMMSWTLRRLYWFRLPATSADCRNWRLHASAERSSALAALSRPVAT